MATPEKPSEDVLKQLRALSHDMSNALEVIIQAQYLLQQSQELSPEDKKWVGMIGKAGAEATDANRKIRDMIRALSVTQAEGAAMSAANSLSAQSSKAKKNADPLI
jgi:signal transduction histidine kinase